MGAVIGLLSAFTEITVKKALRGLGRMAARAASTASTLTHLIDLPDELFVGILDCLDASSVCRALQVTKAVYQWAAVHQRERKCAWRYAWPWLRLCELAQQRVRRRWAGVRSRSLVWNYFIVVDAPSRRVRCCCIQSDGVACGQMLANVRSTATLRNHLQRCHPGISLCLTCVNGS